GGDQEALAAAAENWSEAEAVAFLLGRCVTGVRPGAIPALAVEEIEAAMERVSPAVDVDLDVACPECGHTFVQAVDLSRLVLDEKRIGRDRLFREVHTLALCYHW